MMFGGFKKQMKQQQQRAQAQHQQQAAQQHTMYSGPLFKVSGKVTRYCARHHQPNYFVVTSTSGEQVFFGGTHMSYRQVANGSGDNSMSSAFRYAHQRGWSYGVTQAEGYGSSLINIWAPSCVDIYQVALAAYTSGAQIEVTYQMNAPCSQSIVAVPVPTPPPVAGATRDSVHVQEAKGPICHVPIQIEIVPPGTPPPQAPAQAPGMPPASAPMMGMQQPMMGGGGPGMQQGGKPGGQ